MPPTEPTLVKDWVHIHRVIARALVIDTIRGIEYLEMGFPSSRSIYGYATFNRCLVTMMVSHHQAEELVAFPALRKLIPQAPYEELTTAHDQIEGLLALIPGVLSEMTGDNEKTGLRVLIIILRKLAKAWGAHIQQEEDCFSSHIITPEIDVQVQQQIQRTISHFKHEHTRPPYWVIPFLLFHIRQEEEISLAAYMAAKNIDQAFI